MMRIYSYIVLNLYVISAASSTALVDYDIPGIFSDVFCKDSILRQRFEPICKCKEIHNVTDVLSLCRSHVEYGHCVEHHLNLDIWGFVNHTFSRKKFVYALNYICGIYDNAAGIEKCSTVENALKCTKMFANSMKNYTSVDEESACLLTEKMSDCVGLYLKNNCSANVQYFWSKISQSYMASHCTKYLDASRARKCVEMFNLFHPNRREYSYLECLDVVDMMRDCFLLERQYSLHHADIWYNKGFGLERYIRFERYRCKIQDVRKQDLHCETPRRKQENDKCRDNHNTGFNHHVDMIKNGSEVSVPVICSLYDRLMTCIQKAFEDCPRANAEHQLASYCGQMPVSCYCPIVLESNVAHLLYPGLWNLLLICVIYLLMIHF